MKNGLAFTLVELLVVIAIISVLAAMLMPTLEDALETARQMQCMGNLRQICIGAQQYADESKGWTHAAYGGPPSQGGNGTYWFQAMNSYITDTPRKPSAMLDPLIELEPIWYCPSWDHAVGFGYGMRFSFSVYGRYSHGYFNFSGKKVSCVRGEGGGADVFTYPWGHSQFILFSDSIYSVSPDLYSDSVGYYRRQIWGFADNSTSGGFQSFNMHLRHNASAVAAFADGHAEGAGEGRIVGIGFEDTWASSFCPYEIEY